VRFRWRDSQDHNQIKQMSLDAVEFIRRFLLHILPSGFVKIRHFGFLSNRTRKAMVQLCRELLPPSAVTPAMIERHEPLCPVCKIGHLGEIETQSQKSKRKPEKVGPPCIEERRRAQNRKPCQGKDDRQNAAEAGDDCCKD